jgi:hypothetical protein
LVEVDRLPHVLIGWMKLKMKLLTNTQFDVDRAAAEWQFEINQVAASMSMKAAD